MSEQHEQQTKMQSEQQIDGRDTSWTSRLKFDDNGLIPAVIQDAQSKEVLMLAYMNQESLEKTLDSGETWFWSRARQALWHKGETSGHVQRVVNVAADCDNDALLVQVQQTGPACHTGLYSCFHQPIGEESPLQQAGRSYDIIDRLIETIAKRDAERPEGAYTTYLFEKGVDKILKKVGEETAEVIIAAKNRSHEELRYEASDLIYHLLVLLREQGLPFEAVLRELERRHAAQ